jgi:hypothetical protein
MPREFVLVSLTVLVRASVTVTVAPGMTPPEESVTVPRMVPRSVPWPNTTPAAENRKPKKTTQVYTALYIEETSLTK